MKVYTHTQFGDHVVTFGIIKEYSKQYDEVILTISDNAQGTLVSSSHNDNIKRLFSSIPNVVLTTERFADNEYDKIISSGWWYEQVKPWFENQDLPYTLGDNMIGDRFWYILGGVPFYLKWDNFYFERDPKKEKEAYYDIFGLKENQQYLFLHEDPKRNNGICINRKYVSDMYRVIELAKYPEVSVLDILYTIEKAKEVHIINTGLRSFIDLMNINHNNLIYHKYTRPNPVEQAAMRLNWKVIDKF